MYKDAKLRDRKTFGSKGKEVGTWSKSSEEAIRIFVIWEGDIERKMGKMESDPGTKTKRFTNNAKRKKNMLLRMEKCAE